MWYSNVMKIILDEQKYKKINDLAERNGLDLVVIFGSQVKGTLNKESDIDIGIYGKDFLNLDDKINLSRDFSDIFENDNVDISVISPYSPLLALQILSKGKILYEREVDIAGMLKLYSWKLLAESKSFRDHSYMILKERIAMLNKTI